jgi:hypothetical protein
MRVNIERAIKSITEKIGFYQPLCESIINSFQASATEVNIDFDIDNDKRVIGYSIKDNGEGYTTDNINSFLEFWSEYKVKQFALGSGRILCLKVFDDIIIESQTKDSGEESGRKVYIKFNKSFRASSIEDVDGGKFEEIKRTINSSSISSTKTTFKNKNEDYTIEDNENVFDETHIAGQIFIELLPMFIDFEKNEKSFSIKINNKLWLDKENLNKKFKDLDFKEKNFIIQESKNKSNKHEFNLKYRISKKKNPHNQKIIQFYGAADRKIRSFPSGVALSSLKDGYYGVFCLTSNYFDSRVKDSRKDFLIPMNQHNPTPDDPITFPQINKELADILNTILKENFKGINKEFNDKKINVIKDYPHLFERVNEITNLTLNESEIYKFAEEIYLKKTKEIRDEVISFTAELKKDKLKFDEVKYKDLTNRFTTAGRERLADYIAYRQIIIDMLLEIHKGANEDKLSFFENDIHNLFMPKKNTSDTLSKYGNNAWIFDDKFMSYIYAASDVEIKKIVSDVTGKSQEEISEYYDKKRPDLVLFYSDNNEEAPKDILLIEFKRLCCNSKQKEDAITQLKKYSSYLDDNIKNSRTIFAYLIIDFDDEFVHYLTRIDGFHKVAFGVDDKDISGYYKYNEEVRAHLNVLSFSQVLEDAKKRNKTFLDILIQNFENK